MFRLTTVCAEQNRILYTLDQVPTYFDISMIGPSDHQDARDALLGSGDYVGGLLATNGDGTTDQDKFVIDLVMPVDLVDFTIVTEKALGVTLLMFDLNGDEVYAHSVSVAFIVCDFEIKLKQRFRKVPYFKVILCFQFAR